MKTFGVLANGPALSSFWACRLRGFKGPIPMSGPCRDERPRIEDGVDSSSVASGPTQFFVGNIHGEIVVPTSLADAHPDQYMYVCIHTVRRCLYCTCVIACVQMHTRM